MRYHKSSAISETWLNIIKKENKNHNRKVEVDRGTAKLQVTLSSCYKLCVLSRVFIY